MIPPPDARIEEARAALGRGDAAGARASAESALQEMPDRGDAIEILATADYLDLRFTDAIENLVRAYAAYRGSGDPQRAIRVARMLAGLHYSFLGDFAVSSGWLARAETLLDGTDDVSGRGWVTLNRGMFEADPTSKTERLREALGQARAARDTDMEVSALAYLGANLVHSGEGDEGMRLLDEALAAVTGEEVDDFFVLEEVFCQLFSACEHARDVVRADQWSRVGEAVAARRNLPTVSAFCRTHYGGVLTAAGRWTEADETLTDAIHLWELGGRSSLLRGGALARLADLRVRQGRYEDAEALLAELEPAGWTEAARPRAAVHLARGDVDVAREALEAALDQLPPTSAEAATLLESLVEALIADGDLAEAERQLARLDLAFEATGNRYVKAMAALSRGRLRIASGDGDPLPCLREAATEFSRAQVPLETALARLTLARALAPERPTAALDEARAALEVFERLEAYSHADAAQALMRSLGVRPTTGRVRGGVGVLTAREAEVLELLGHGLSNPEIAKRLYISRKTVEHHVGNILAKLGLRSRAEAAAHAVQHRSAQPSEPASD